MRLIGSQACLWLHPARIAGLNAQYSLRIDTIAAAYFEALAFYRERYQGARCKSYGTSEFMFLKLVLKAESMAQEVC